MSNEVRPMFTWIPLFRQITEKVLEYQNKRDDLTQKVNNAFQDAAGWETTAKSVQVDPFQLFACVGFRGGDREKGPELKIEWLQAHFDITVVAPEDHDGIPYGRFAPHWRERPNGQVDVDKLWNLALAALENNESDLIHYFDDCMENIKDYKKTRISYGLFLMRPDRYLPINQAIIKFLDGHGISSFPSEWDVNKVTGANYLKYCSEVMDKLQSIYPVNTFPFISLVAQREWSKNPNP